MNGFKAKRITKTYSQINHASPDKVFPLLCPVREKDWIDGWEYDMVYSQSGLAEQGCVFTTPFAENKIFTWYVTKYDRQQFIIEFVRMACGEMIVKINIQLIKNENDTTIADILYEYTSLNEETNQWMEEQLDAVFDENMRYWEKAINHYLQTGMKLLKK